jgi:hypothetical protein
VKSANHPAAGKAGIALELAFVSHRPGLPEPARLATSSNATHLPQRRPLTRPFNPFAHIAGGPALGLGLAAILLASPMSSTTAAPARLLGNTPLPEPVPYLNKKENFLVGNGIAAGGGSGHGRWDYLVGPDYTCPNYLRNEEFRLVVDGEERGVGVDVHRLRGSGLFYGVCAVGDLEFCLLDYALWGEPWVARLVLIRNTSAAQEHSVRVQARISPLTGIRARVCCPCSAWRRGSHSGMTWATSSGEW